MFEVIKSPATAGDGAVADQGGDSSTDREASGDSRSGYDSPDSRDYNSGDNASDLSPPGDVSLKAAPPKAAPDLGLVHDMARCAGQAMQFETDRLNALASAPPAEALKVEPKTEALKVEPKAEALKVEPKAEALKVEQNAEAQGAVVPKIHGGPLRPEPIGTPWNW